MSYAEDEGHDIPYDMLDFMSSEDTDWDSAWEREQPSLKATIGASRKNIDRGVWIARDGTKYLISKMQTSHIKNCIRMIQRSNYYWRPEYLEPLTQELKRRQQCQENTESITSQVHG